MIVYIGVSFALFGTFLLIVSAASPQNVLIYGTLGAFVSAMGLILSLLGLKAGTNGTIDNRQDRLLEACVGGEPLAHLESEIETSLAVQKRINSNKAFGFVLIALGAFVITVSGTIGLFLGSWPLLLLGIGFVSAGVTLYRA
ncbi:MAG TPA: hypothetical protein VLA68_05280 [Nitrososphaera sp.]|nr:hypothetical protein [Nitrososphaera sp.]